MSIKLNNGRPMSHEEIAAFERMVGHLLPQGIKNFFSKYDGAEPDTNIFNIGETNDSGVNQFIPMRRILAEMVYVDNLPQYAFPIAWVEGGNYVIIKPAERGAVYFWDHEKPADMTFLADSFDAFFSSIKPFDVIDVNLKPGQVISAWVDPDFLKDLNEEMR